MPDPGQVVTWRREVRRELGIAEHELVMGTASRLHPAKRQIVLLEALALLKERGHILPFLIVGDGTARPEMEAYCRDHALGEVRFLGWQRGIMPYVAAMDAFAFHSMPGGEGLPTVVLEAAACGRPLIVADIECLAEVFEDEREVLCATAGDARAFCDAIERVILDRGPASAMGEAARMAVVRRFSTQAMAERYTGLYAAILDGGA
jgi:glycosyltransferase involved in cell wall biosynthesis